MLILSYKTGVPPFQGNEQGDQILLPTNNLSNHNSEGVASSGTLLAVGYSSSGDDFINFHTGPITSLVYDSNILYEDGVSNLAGLTADGSNNLVVATGGGTTPNIDIHSGFTSTVSSSFSPTLAGSFVNMWIYDGNLYTSDSAENVNKHAGVTATISTTISLSTALGANNMRGITFNAAGDLCAIAGNSKNLYVFEGFTNTLRAGFNPLDVSAATGNYPESIGTVNGEVILIDRPAAPPTYGLYRFK